VTVYPERVADFTAEPFAELVALNKKMETEPARDESQKEQDGDQDQKANAFHANEIIKCGMELASAPGN